MHVRRLEYVFLHHYMAVHSDNLGTIDTQQLDPVVRTVPAAVSVGARNDSVKYRSVDFSSATCRSPAAVAFTAPPHLHTHRVSHRVRATTLRNP